MSKTWNGMPVLNSYPSSYFVAPGGKHVYVATDDIAIIVQYFSDFYDENIEAIARSAVENHKKPRERYGTYVRNGKTYYDLVGIHSFRDKPNKSTGDDSNHRSASAWDINGHLHPYEYTMAGNWYSGFTSSQTSKIRKLIATVTDDRGRVLIRWGVDFAKGRRDGMHYELIPGITSSQIRQAARKLEKYVGRSGNAIFEKATGADVGAWQRTLKSAGFPVAVDEMFGPATTRATKQLQIKVGVKADGRVGDKTRLAAKNYDPKLEEDMSTLQEIKSMIEALPGSVWAFGLDPRGQFDRNDPNFVQPHAATHLRYTARSSDIARVEKALSELNGHEVDVKALAELLSDDIADAVAKAVSDLELPGTIDVQEIAKATTDHLAKRMAPTT